MKKGKEVKNLMNEEYEEDVDYIYYEDEEEICPEGYKINECCNCIAKYGVEECVFTCPFGGPPRCGEEQAKKCEKEFLKRMKEMAEFLKRRNPHEVG